MDKILSGIIGHAVGDALGVPVEFLSRKELNENPITEMTGFGTYNMPKGTWSDDTTMTLCLMDSLSKGLDYYDIMDKFALWLLEGEYTPFGEAFDVGNATNKAINRYIDKTKPLECGGITDQDNGNGALMRILPLCFYLFHKDMDETLRITREIAGLTHNHDRSHIACAIYVLIGKKILDGKNLHDSIEEGIYEINRIYENNREINKYKRLSQKDFYKLKEEDIDSSGYVVSTLEASIWCLLNTKTYKEAVLKAVNLGLDTDTVGAVTGGLAGLYYGYEAIPKEWVNDLVKKDYIIEIAKRFAKKVKCSC